MSGSGLITGLKPNIVTIGIRNQRRTESGLIVPKGTVKKPEVPPGKVLIDGELVDRTNVVFKLVEDEKDPRLLKDLDGSIYTRLKNGALKKIWPKKKEKRKGKIQ